MVFSIIIPHYNSTKLLLELLESIPKENDIQIIVVDDNSSKEEKEKLSLMQQKFPMIEIYNNSVNKGAGYCRNMGLSKAKGKWILFADSDDIFNNNFYETIKNNEFNPNDVIFFPSTSFLDKNYDEIGNRHSFYVNLINEYKLNPTNENKLKLIYFFVVPWSKMIKKEIIDENSIYFEEIELSNDLLFSARLGTKINKFDISDDVIYKVRMREGSMVNVISSERFLKRVNAWCDYVAYIKNNISAEDFKMLNFSGRSFWMQLYNNKLGYSVFLETVKILKKHNIPLIDKEMLNPYLILNKFISSRKKHKINKKYLKTENKK